MVAKRARDKGRNIFKPGDGRNDALKEALFSQDQLDNARRENAAREKQKAEEKARAAKAAKEQKARAAKAAKEQKERAAEADRKQKATEARKYERFIFYEQPNKGGQKCFINPYTFLPVSEDEPERKSYSPSFKSAGVEEEGNDVNNGSFVIDYANSYTGVLVCSAEIANGSGLFVPNTSGSGEKGKPARHRIEDFYSYKDLSTEAKKLHDQLPKEEPNAIVPGSEIRGSVRSVYEFVTNSCLVETDEENRPLKRTALPKTPYLMVWDDSSNAWELYANPIVLKLGKENFDKENFDKEKKKMDNSGAEAYIIEQTIGNETTEFPGENNSGNHAKEFGYWSFTYLEADREGSFVKKATIVEDGTPNALLMHATGLMKGRHLTLFNPDPQTAGGRIENWAKQRDDALIRFEEVINDYCSPDKTEKNARKAAEIYEPYRKRYIKKESILVYADEQLKYLSPASITKESFQATVSEILDRQSKHAKCSGEEGFCPACRLFGAVGKKISIGSRLRFSDSSVVSNSKFAKRTLPILATPKITATEFYLLKPTPSDAAEKNKALTWNYDYYLTKQENIQDEKKFYTYTWHYVEDGYEPELAGRKMYWHSPLLQSIENCKLNKNIPKTKMNSTVRYLKEGSFSFEVYFEDISAEELNDLIFAIGGMGSGSGSGRLQKLGRAKPYGMGSVLMKVDKITLRKYVLKNATIVVQDEEPQPDWYATLQAPEDPAKALAKEKIEYLTKMPSDLQRLVSYPRNYPIDENTKTDNFKGIHPLNEEDPIYKWFVKNRGKVNSPEIKETLDTLDF